MPHNPTPSPDPGRESHDPTAPSDPLQTAWEAGLRAGMDFERDRWYWSAGPISRAAHGLHERPQRPVYPGPEKGAPSATSAD